MVVPNGAAMIAIMNYHAALVAAHTLRFAVRAWLPGDWAAVPLLPV
jgi:hypothetical protein